MKKIATVLFFLTICFFTQKALAVTPSISVLSTSNSDMVQINVVGDANSNVFILYYSSTASGAQMRSIGQTNSSGSLSTEISLSSLNVSANSSVGAMVNSQQSSVVAWPTTSVSTNLSINQSSLVLNVGQSSTLTVSNNGTNAIYLSSNSNPQTANISISGNQVTATGIGTGSTVATICKLNYSSNCVSAYIVVQSASASSLTFNQNNVSIVSGQNIQITISGGGGFYQVLNNSNSSVIGTNLNGPTLTLYANGTSGTSTMTVCSTDMSACGVVNASIGSYSSTGLTFSQNNPTILTGQTYSVNIYGGYGTYYVSSNSSSAIAQTYIATSSIAIYGSTPGNTTIVICSTSGSCGTITATVSSSNSGKLILAQSEINLTIGQVISILVSGGSMPYSLVQNNDGIAQYSLNGTYLTITGSSKGNSSVTVCSASGACVALTAVVGGTTTSTGVQPAFSQNNVTLTPAQSLAVYLSGNGGYYVSSNSNSNIASASISGNSVVLYGVSAGSANVSVCQTGGQCNTLYFTVSNAVTSTANPITFSKQSISIEVNQVSSLSIYGGTGEYYVSSNSNPDVISTYLSGSMVAVFGKSAGSSIISVCSSTSVCASISVIVSNSATIQTTTPTAQTSTKYKFINPLRLGSKGTDVTKLQERLKEEGVYDGPITGYYGNLTVTAVKKYQKSKKLDQLGNVGPGTRAALNK